MLRYWKKNVVLSQWILLLLLKIVFSYLKLSRLFQIQAYIGKKKLYFSTSIVNYPFFKTQLPDECCPWIGNFPISMGVSSCRYKKIYIYNHCFTSRSAWIHIPDVYRRRKNISPVLALHENSDNNKIFIYLQNISDSPFVRRINSIESPTFIQKISRLPIFCYN